MGHRAEHRPDPEELLRRVQAVERRERRGRLKVFLGYASRVGKSFRMFDEGRRRAERGQDVVVGAVQPATQAEIGDTLSRLEIIPPVIERHAGQVYEVIDLAALFRRHPAVVLIDGLAFDNPPGSRNPHRWQDVDDLLDRGIAVITAVNLQHIREKQEEVERITGKRAANSIPEEFLREADEIEVVDAPPEALIGRGNGALDSEARRLNELRESALLLAADVVEWQLQEYLDSHGIAARWATQERILVCLTPRSSAIEMLESGRRSSLRFHGALLAVHMKQSSLRPEERQLLNRHLAYARELGAEVHCLPEGDFVDALLDFAREHRITQIFLGHTGRERTWWGGRGPIERLIDGAEDFDLKLFPHKEPA